MTLATTPSYDADAVSATRGHAVVVGGSVAGLLTARVLADAYERVTVVERDPLPDEPTVRRGAPQARHIHVLQEAGRATIDDVLPGYTDDLVAAGAEQVDIATEFEFYDEDGLVADAPEPLPMYCATRPLFEAVTRRRVGALDGVRLLGGRQVVDYRVERGSATGVVLRDGETVAADLVVDATGRASRTPSWLDDNGYPSPPVDEVRIDLKYATVTLDRPSDERRAAVVMPAPPRTRGVGLVPVEDGRWLLTAFGVHGDHPPDDVAGLVDFAASLPIDGLDRLVEEREVLGPVEEYPFPSNLRRRYWDLDRFPDGLLVVGDAIASFNPIYGQGMSVAALETLHLHHALAGGRSELPRRFFDRVETVVDDAWRLAVGADFRFPETSGPKPVGIDLLNGYLSRLTRKAHEDEVLAEAYSRVVRMERRPTSLLRPGVAWRVFTP